MIRELLRAPSRLVVLTAIAAGLAGCSSERFDHYNDNRYAARPAPQPEPAPVGAYPGSSGMAPSSRIEQAPLPPPSGMSGPMSGAASGPVSAAPDAGYSGGGRSMGMASYQPTYQSPPPVPPEITGSAAPRKPAGASSPWSWEGGTAIIVAPGETIDVIAQRHNVPAAALVEANSLPAGAAIRPGQRLVIPRYMGAAPSAAPAPSAALSPVASNAARPSPAPVSAIAPAQPVAVTGSSGLHVVAAGDTLYKISRTYGRSVADLAKANNIEPTATLKIGDRIVIPGGPASHSVAKSTPKGSQPLAAPSAKAAAAGRAAASAKAAAAGKAAAPKAQPAKATPAPKQPESQQAAVVTPSDETPAPTPIKADATPTFRWPVKGRVIAGFGPKPNGQQNDGINLAVPEGTPVKAAEDGVVAYAGNELKGYGNLVLIRHSNGYVTAYAHAKELLVKRGDSVKRGQVIANSGQTGNVDTPQLHFEVRKGPAPLDPMPLLAGG
jgi:murein DD-endopeptidase MepM/ murein hydrolase activator NlpD